MNSSSPVGNKLSHVQLMQRAPPPPCNYTPRLSIFHGTASVTASLSPHPPVLQVASRPPSLHGRTDGRTVAAPATERWFGRAGGRGGEGPGHDEVYGPWPPKLHQHVTAIIRAGKSGGGANGAFLSISLNHPEAANSIFCEWTKLRIRSTEPLLALTSVRWVPIANMFLGPGRPAL